MMKGKWLFGAAVVLTVMVACQMSQRHMEAPEEAEESDFEEVPDSFFCASDTLPMDEELAAAPLPVTVDELFDDFVFLFDQSNRIQRQRILFPLVITEADGETHTMTRKDWEHRSLFLGQDFCTVLWSSRHQMAMAEDSTISQASVEQIYLHSRQIETYRFERDSMTGQWMLVAQYEEPFEQCDLQDFLDFYRQFATDSIYQRSHLKNPLRFTMTDENLEDGTIAGTIDADQWFEFAPDIPQDVITNIRYGQSYRAHNHILMQLRGINNGLQNIFSFSRDDNGRWRLTAFEN